MKKEFGVAPCGIHIRLFIQPHQISAEEWKNTYEESLKVIRRALLMECYKPNGANHLYARGTAHIDDIDGQGYGGWKVDGSMATGHNTDSFCLYDDINYYRSLVSNDECEDHILKDLLSIRSPHGYVQIWDGATNGMDAHIYLLAVAYIICDRLPNAAYVDGDISLEQLDYVYNWLNYGAKVSVEKLYHANVPGLIAELRRAGFPEEDMLMYFHYFSLCGINRSVGAQIKKLIEPALIRKHYLDTLMPYVDENGKVHISEYGIREYLTLDFDFEVLCKLVMIDIDGCNYPPEDFVKMLLDMNLHIEKPKALLEGVYVLSSDPPVIYKENRLCHPRSVLAYIPLEQMEATFSTVLGERFHVSEALPDYDLSSGIIDYDYKTIQTANALYRHLGSVPREFYDIEHSRELINYTPGKSLHPELRKAVVSFFRSIQSDSETSAKVLRMNNEGRKQWFEENCSTPVAINVEEDLYRHIDNDEYIRPFIALYASDIDPIIKHVALFNTVFRTDSWALASREL